MDYDPEFVVDEEVLEPLLFHLQTSWSRNCPQKFNYILNFLADLFQHPHRKLGVALLLFSQPGAGKGIVLNFLGEYLLGDLYVSLPTLKQITGGFNALLARKLLVNLDEIASANDSSVSDRTRQS